MKQNLGIFSWLAKLEKTDKNFAIFFGYISFILPLLFMHLRSAIDPNSIVHGVLPVSDNLRSLITHFISIEILGNVISALIIITGLCFLYLYWRRTNHFRLWFYILNVACLNIATLIYGKNFYEIFVPLVASHGLTYILVVSYSLTKVHSWTKTKAIAAVCTLALLYGFFEWWIHDEDFMLEMKETYSSWILMGIGLTVGLNVAHYLIDGFI